MTKLTRETIEHLLQPGVLFQDDGSIMTLQPLEGEELENANAAYRVGFLFEDIDAVLKEVNAKRGFTSDDEVESDDDADLHTCSTQSDSNLSPSLTEIFGSGITLQNVEIKYQGITIHIGSVDL